MCRKAGVERQKLRLVRVSRRNVWRTQITTRVTLILELQEEDEGGVGEEDEGFVGGRRTSVVFDQATRRVERDEEFFANYGTVFRFSWV